MTARGISATGEWGRGQLFWIVCAALVLRLGLIFLFKGGGYDLRIYEYFGDIMRQGGNPYAAPAGGLIDPKYADMSPLNIGLFASVLAVWRSRIAIRIMLAVVDVFVLLGLARQSLLPIRVRNRVCLFYAFNPLILLAWVVAAEDKNIVFGLLGLLLAAMVRRRALLASAICGILAAYKFIGFFIIIPVLLDARREKAPLAGSVLLLLGILIVSHVPFFPDSLAAYLRRIGRGSSPSPMHASPMNVVDWLGLYRAWLPLLVMGAGVAFAYLLQLKNKLTSVETAALVCFVVCVSGPDAGIDRLLLGTLPLMLFLRYRRTRTALLWGLSIAASLALFWELGPPSWIPGVRGLASLADPIFGGYASHQHVLFMNALPWAVFLLFLRDRVASRSWMSPAARLAQGQVAPAQ